MGKEGAEPVEVRNSIFYSRLTLDGANSIPVLMQRLTMYLLELVVPSALCECFQFEMGSFELLTPTVLPRIYLQAC